MNRIKNVLKRFLMIILFFAAVISTLNSISGVEAQDIRHALKSNHELYDQNPFKMIGLFYKSLHSQSAQLQKLHLVKRK
ncbi:hypothetical protein LC087_10075 [Bacillus carboniphilus]|uniref:Uncharacterized protein n=1 Tax=Bacillus carboniphilus TaxID=86663 RepID=A0ABY9JUC1_9BACI|nr:hypothetical protein [Bacillus carboniphilus]WLR41281.1 hypothetical protein LC087_10075 [Bacillus carboniphilus]